MGGAGNEAISTDDTIAAAADDAISTDDTVGAAANDEAISTDDDNPAADVTVTAQRPVGGDPRAVDTAELPIKPPARYVRGREIARGGMGKITAVHDKELRREIAIKELISPSPALERRFEREVLVSARLQHPAIIAVHEAGRWPTGEPFYTMKHVEGRALDKVIAEKSTLIERLSLLPNVLAVADALAYAHTEGVIHRDLKPGNILVGSFGETVVIDWGLAKELGDADEALEPDQADPVDGLTLHGQALGTPAFMPPEQADGALLDERADVYAIGAILYHVLSGKIPYADTKPTSAHELLFTVVEKGPTQLTELQDDIPPDLLTIVEKAMSRDASDRYPTAGELAEDLRRYQTGQLVGAHQYSTWALVKRWIGRHRAAVGVAAVMALVLAVVGTLSFWRIASERDRAETQKTLAEDNRGEVEGLLDFMMVELRDRLEPIGKLELLDTVATKAVQYYQARPDTGSDEELSKRSLALTNIGDVMFPQGRLPEALAEYRAALAIREKLAAQNPSNPDWQHDLSVSHDSVGKVLKAQGDLAAALAAYRAGKAIREKLAAQDLSNATWQRDLSVSHEKVGDVLAAQGDLAAALAAYRAGKAIREKLAAQDPSNASWQRDLSVSHVKVGDVLKAQGDLAAALAAYRAAQAIREKLAAQDLSNASWQRDFSVSQSRVGEVLAAQGDLAAALAAYRAAQAIAEKLAAQDPSNASWQRDLSVSHDRVGNVLKAQGDLAAALAAYRAAQAIAEKLAAQDPSNATWQRDLSVSHDSVGNVLKAQGDLAAALAAYRAAQAIAEKLAARDPSNATWQLDLSLGHVKVGDVLEAQGDLAAALAAYRAGKSIRETLAAQDPSNASWQRDRANDDLRIGGVLQQMGEQKTAREHLARAAALFESSAAVGQDFYNSACTYALSSNADKALAMLDKAVEKGWHDAAWTEKDADLASLRKDPRWKPLIEKMKAAK